MKNLEEWLEKSDNCRMEPLQTLPQAGCGCENKPNPPPEEFTTNVHSALGAAWEHPFNFLSMMHLRFCFY
jgi:hypothetical protein